MALLKESVRRRLSWKPIGLFLILFFQQAVMSAQQSYHVPSKEYQVKATFLFNFIQFIDWPSTAFDGPNAPLIIGVFGENPFGSYLGQTVMGEKINGHPITVKYYNNIPEIKNCQILYIATRQKGRVQTLLESLKGQNILTVSDATDFTKSGGIIRFLTENNKVRLQISPQNANTANLVISSNLLRLAEIVN